MIGKIEIYMSEDFNPYRNLATEKLLLDSVGEDSLILYLWQNEKTVVIGRNQNPLAECNCALLKEENGFLARRLSGGGAVFHDCGNLNFTFLCCTENYDLEKQLRVIQKACEMAGIHAELNGRNDLLADGRKFSGNAFYNSKGKSYHHGTIMVSSDLSLLQRYLTPSQSKLEAKGVKSVKSRVVNLSSLSPSLTVESMKNNMQKAFEEVYDKKTLLHSEISEEKIGELAEYYSSWDYLYGRSAPFSMKAQKRFPWGEITLLLDIRDGKINSAQVFTDSMDWTLSGKVQDALVGCRFKAEEISERLSSLAEGIAEDIFSLLQ